VSATVLSAQKSRQPLFALSTLLRQGGLGERATWKATPPPPKSL
jgi:hypothetical protein